MFCWKLCCGLDGHGFEFQQGQEIFLFSKTVNTGSGAHQVSLKLQRLRLIVHMLPASVHRMTLHTLKNPPTWEVVETFTPGAPEVLNGTR